MPRPSDPILRDSLPPAIAATLRKTVRRIRAILWARGLLATAAAALGSILILMAVDAAFPIYSTVARWCLTSAGLASTLLVAWRALARPLSRPLTPARTAAILEARHPELEERISTVVELLDSPDAARADLLSGELFGVLSREAEADASAVLPQHEFSMRSVRPFLAAFVAAVAVLAALFLAAPDLVGRLFVRAVAPYAELDNAFGGTLHVRPGDAICLLGEPFTVELDTEPGLLGSPYIRCRAIAADGSYGPEIPERMRSASPDGETRTAPPPHDAIRRYVHTIPAVASSFQYRVSCGLAVTRRYTVTAVAPPAVSSLTVTLDHPAYTGRERTIHHEDTPSDIVALPGTLVTFEATFNRSDLSDTLAIPGIDARNISHTPGASVWTAPVIAGADTTWTLSLRDGNGYTNVPAPRLFRAVPDQPPSIVLKRPETTRLRLPPDSTLDIRLVASDDVGLTTPELWYRAASDSGDSASSADAVLLRPVRDFSPADEDGTWLGADTIDLSALALGDARFVQFHVRVADTLPADLGGPHVATSAVITVELDRTADTLASQTIDALSDHAEESLEEIARRLAAARDAAGAVADRLRNGGALDRIALSDIDTARRDAATARTLSESLAADLANTAFESFGERVSAFATSEAEAARARAEEAQLANPSARLLAIESTHAAASAAHTAAIGLVKEVGHFAGQLRESGGRAQPPRVPRTPRRSDDDWFRIRGSAKSGAAGTDANVPDEYRELVRDYFRALSEGGE